MGTAVGSLKDMGKLIATHGLAFGAKWGALAVSLILIILAPVVFFGLPMVWSGAGTGMEEVLNTTPFLKYLPAILGAILLLTGVLRLFGLWRQWPTTVRVYEKGIEYIGRGGTQQILWEEIKDFTRHITRSMYLMIITVSTSYSFTLTTEDGRIIILDGQLQGLETLGDRIEDGTASMALPAEEAKLQSGGEVVFGPLRVTQKAIACGAKTLEWGKVNQVEMKKGTLTVTEKGSRWGSWAKLDLSEVPNAALFRMIARKYSGGGSA
jgi:hypothetical protein